VGVGVAAGRAGAEGVVALVGRSGVARHVHSEQNGRAGGVDGLPVHRHRDLQIQALIVVVHGTGAIAKAFIFLVSDRFPFHFKGFQGKILRVKTQRL
jgi:hypothetical protein